MSSGITVALARRLLHDAPWAQDRLRPFAGQSIAWEVAGLQGRVVLDAEGLPAAPPAAPAGAAPGASAPDAAQAERPVAAPGAGVPPAGGPGPGTRSTSGGVRVTLAAADLPAITQGMDVLMRHVTIEGNAGLASELAFIARHLALDPADWLAPWLGDVLGERAGRGLREGSAWALQAARRAAQAGAEFAVHEARLLADPHMVSLHCRAVDELREAADRLAQRVARLERGSGQ